MKNVISQSFYDIEKLKPFDNCMVVIPGYIRSNGMTMEEAHDYLIQGVFGEEVMKRDQEFNRLKMSVLEHGSEKGIKFDVNMNMFGDATVECVGVTFAGHARYMVEQVSEDFDVDIKKMTRNSSEKTTIYKLAKELGIKVSVEDCGDFYNVSLRKETVKATVKQSGVMSLINRFILQLPFDEPTEIPSEITAMTSDTYVRTIVNKSHFECSYQRGMLTKHTYRLCNRSSGVEVRTTGKTLARIDNLKISDLTENHKRLLNLKLMPYRISVTDENTVEVLPL